MRENLKRGVPWSFGSSDVWGRSQRQGSLRDVFTKAMSCLLLVTMLVSVNACGETPQLTVTYSIESWSDVQIALDSANNGDVIDLSSLWSPDLPQNLSVPAGLDVILVGHQYVTFYAVSITCKGKNSITIKNLSIKSVNNQAKSTLHFEGKDNHLILEGSNYISYDKASVKSTYGAAIGVPEGSELTVNGSGYLSVRGANGGACIGGGQGKAGGAITINAPNTVFSIEFASGGSGIGGGFAGAGGTIALENGVFQLVGESPVPLVSGEATMGSGGANGAGIGGGASGAGGKITISGGRVSVSSYGGAACIGGGVSGAGGEIYITGGYVSLKNLGSGTCLGGGSGGKEADIKMIGGALNVSAQVTAINGIFSDLPAAYRWQTSDEPIADFSGMKSFPGDPYRGSGTYSYIIIETHEINSITVDPAETKVAPGQTQTFRATVAATGGASTEVRWSINGNTSAETLIDSKGVLTVGSNEKAVTITVMATSIAYSDKTGTATVVVVPTTTTP